MKMSGANEVIGQVLRGIEDQLAAVLKFVEDDVEIDPEEFDGRFGELYQLLEQEIPGRDLSSLRSGDPEVVRVQMVAIKDLTDLMQELFSDPGNLLVMPEK